MEDLEKIAFDLVEQRDLGGLDEHLRQIPKHVDNILLDENGNTLFLHAAKHGNTPALKLLLDIHNANVNLKNREDWNALHFAVFHQHNESVEFLLERRINLFALNSSGLSPLHVASVKGNSSTIKILIKYGADCNEISKSGWSALHLAASSNHVIACQTLLEYKGDPNILKMPQGSPLHLAAKEGHWQTCLALINGGAFLECKDKIGRRPVDVAEKESRTWNILNRYLESPIDTVNVKQRNLGKEKELCIEKEEEILDNIEKQLLSDINEYVAETANNRKSILNIKNDSVNSEEARFSLNVRIKSGLPSLLDTCSVAPSVSVWKDSGLDEGGMHNEDYEYERRGSTRADNVLMAFGKYPGGKVYRDDIVAYPGASSKVIQSSNMLWSWLSRVVGAVIDRHAQESMEQILRLLNTLFGDKNQTSSVKSLLSLSALILYHNDTHVSSGRIIEDNNIIDSTIHFFKFSCAAYGWKMLNPLMFANKRKAVLVHGFLTGDVMNNRALCEHTGIQEEDIVTTKWTSSDYHPAHYIAIDHSTLSIVIAIRGSFHVKDALVDLVAAATPFQGGYAHTGMLECARRKLDMIRLPLLQTIAQNPQYQVVVIGHSLGAGTAALLTLLLKNELPCSVRLRCLAFAPPCVLSPNLAKGCEGLIDSFILGNDCVPRLSFASIQKLKELTGKLMDQGSSGVSILLKAKRGQISIEDLKNEIHFQIDTALLPPGTCYHIAPETKDTAPAWLDKAYINKCFRMELSCPTLFSEVIVSSTMFSDHVPWNYQAAFEGLFKRQTLFNQQNN